METQLIPRARRNAQAGHGAGHLCRETPQPTVLQGLGQQAPAGFGEQLSATRGSFLNWPQKRSRSTGSCDTHSLCLLLWPVTSEIPAKGLLGLVLRSTVHVLPGAKLWGPGPGKADPAGRLHNSFGQVYEQAECASPGATVRVTRGHCAALTQWLQYVCGAVGAGGAGTAGGSVLSHRQAAADAQSSFVLLPLIHPCTSPSYSQQLLLASSRWEPRPCCPPGSLPGSARPRTTEIGCLSDEFWMKTNLLMSTATSEG